MEKTEIVIYFVYHFIYQLQLDEATDAWGIKVERVEM